MIDKMFDAGTEVTNVYFANAQRTFCKSLKVESLKRS
jgi:hypothetical protein